MTISSSLRHLSNAMVEELYQCAIQDHHVLKAIRNRRTKAAHLNPFARFSLQIPMTPNDEPDQNIYRQLFESSPDPSWIIEGGILIESNAVAVATLGIKSAAEILSLHPSKSSPARQPDGLDSCAEVERMMSLALDKGSHRFERDFTKTDGTNFTAEVTLSVVKLDRKQVLYCVCRDISERKNMEDRLLQQNKTLQAFVESFPGGISVFDARLRLVAYNQNLKKLLDLPDTLFEKPNLSFEDFIRFNVERGDYGPGDFKTKVSEIVERARKFRQHQFQRVRPNGMVLEIRGVPLPEGGFSTTYMDVTERELAAQRLRIAATAFESQEGMLITDASRNILKVNQAFSEITGYSAEEAVGRTPGILKSGRHGASFYQDMADSLLQRGRWQGEIWNRRKSGEIYPEWLMVTAVKDDGGNITHYVGALTDITSRKSAENEIRTLAFHDALTQLPNRRLLSDRLAQSMASSKRSGRYGAVMFLDLDNFKPINDTHGHEVGDLLLIEAAKRLKCAVREMDTVARFGGDEFVVILSELNANSAESVATTKRIAEKICTVLSAPYQLIVQHEGKAESMVEHRCTASLGIAMFLNQDVDRNEILKSADLAMYEAKEAGGNAIRFHPISNWEK